MLKSILTLYFAGVVVTFGIAYHGFAPSCDKDRIRGEVPCQIRRGFTASIFWPLALSAVVVGGLDHE